MPEELSCLRLAEVEKGLTYEIRTRSAVYYVSRAGSNQQSDSEDVVYGLEISGSASVHTAPSDTYAQAVVTKGKKWAVNGVTTRDKVERITLYVP